MRVTKIFENIGWGKYPNDEIKYVNIYSESNDYEGTFVYINGEEKGNSCSELDAFRNAGIDDELANWILRH